MIYHGLTLKQKKFADEYIISGNATEARIRAGYSKKTARSVGSENLTKPNIKQYITERMAEMDKRYIADQEEILAFLTSVMRGQEAQEQLAVVGTGDGCSEAVKVDIKAPTKEQIKAAELLGKRYAMWTEKVDQTSTAAVVISGEDNLED